MIDCSNEPHWGPCGPQCPIAENADKIRRLVLRIVYLRAWLLLASSACVSTPTIEWIDGKPVRAAVRGAMSEASRLAFEQRVERDVEAWRSVLIERGCPAPFYYAPDDESAGLVTLTPNARWLWPGSVGVWDADPLTGVWGVFIRAEGDGTLDTYADDPRWVVGLHELGHALGLHHTPCDGEPSIMTEEGCGIVESITPRDARDAASLLGCE